jgi:hypothetical protein
MLPERENHFSLFSWPFSRRNFMIKKNGTSRLEKTFWCIALLLALAAALWQWLPHTVQGETQAAVFYDGKRVALLPLEEYDTPLLLSMDDLGVAGVPVKFELYHRQIRFIDVQCPDKLCEGFGFIGEPTQTAVCMPNRVSVTILSAEEAALLGADS